MVFRIAYCSSPTTSPHDRDQVESFYGFVDLQPWFDPPETEVSQEVLANKLLRLLTVDRDVGIRSGDVIQISGAYLSREYASTIPSYARYVGGSGKMMGRVFLSHDKTIKYLFIQDEDNRVMLSGAELLTAPVSLLGVRTRYLDTRGMDTPLMEYGAQIPEQYGGRKKYRYQSAWALVRELPLIERYYRDLGKKQPPVSGGI